MVLPAAALAFQMLAARRAKGWTNTRLSAASTAVDAGRDRVEAQSA